MSTTDDLPFGVRVARSGEATILDFHGDLDLTAVAVAGEALERAQESGGLVVLDLRALRFMDSSGLRVVLEAQRRAATSGARLQVAPGEAGIRRVFEISGVAALIELVDAPPEAA